MRSALVTLAALALTSSISATAQELEPSSGATVSATSADLARASKMWISGDYEGAVKLWQSLTDSRDAYYNLGQAYRLGRGVSASPRLSRAFYEKALNAGHPKAAEQLGLMLFNDASTRASAIPYLMQASANGSPRAEMALGLWNMEGSDQPNFELARVHLTNAAAARIPGSSAALAKLSLKSGADVAALSEQDRAGMAAAAVAEAVTIAGMPSMPATPAQPALTVATMGLPGDNPPVAMAAPAPVIAMTEPAMPQYAAPSTPPAPAMQTAPVMQVEASDEVLVYSSPSGNYTRKVRPSDGEQPAPVVIWW